MAKRMISMGSIDQFRTIVKNVQHTAQYVRYDEETQESIMNRDAKMPVITAIGTEKIHGSNAAVCLSNKDGFWVQSRKNIITPEKDNAGCAFQAYANKGAWIEIMADLAAEYNIDLDENIISVYYEWSGGNIQKKSALTGLDKRAMIFQHFKVSPIEPQLDNNSEENGAKWLETVITPGPGEVHKWVENREANIFNIMMFPAVAITIDFAEPLMSQNKMIQMVENLEKSSGVGESFGIPGNVGEGYVFTFEYNGNIHRFKVKGELHASIGGTYKVNTKEEIVTINGNVPSKELQYELRKQLGEGIYTFSL